MAIGDQISYGIGVNLEDPDDEPKFNLGTKAFGPDGKQYVYGISWVTYGLYKNDHIPMLEGDKMRYHFGPKALLNSVVTVIYDDKIRIPGRDYLYAMKDEQYGWFLMDPGTFSSPI